jgi:hypothetical protein
VTDHRPDWDLARLAPLTERAVNILWNHHAHQRLTPHRFQELLAELSEMLYDPELAGGEHPAAAVRPTPPPVEVGPPAGYRRMVADVELARANGLPHAVAGIGVAEASRLARVEADWRTQPPAAAHLRMHPGEPDPF